jgi:hypothetical protein
MCNNYLSCDPKQYEAEDQYLLDLKKAGEVVKLFDGYTISKARYILDLAKYQLEDTIIRGE